jgi:hypothetical protein
VLIQPKALFPKPGVRNWPFKPSRVGNDGKEDLEFARREAGRVFMPPEEGLAR